jgi:uncharacterized protein (TIGR03437 family)
MCRCETGVLKSIVRIRRLVLLAGIYTATAFSVAAQPAVAWKSVAGYTIQENLAGLASGPVRAVWFSPSGNRLLAVTGSNRVFETTDFEHWRLNTTDTTPATPATAPALRLPEQGAHAQVAGARLYAQGPDNIFASDDNGRTWLNLTGYNNSSILGGGFTSLAVSPANSQELAASNQFGVWRSMDGGLSWHGLNEDLPNLPVRKLPGRRVVSLLDGSVLQFDSGTWTLAGAAEPEAALRQQLSARAGVTLTAASQSGGVAYGGTADGKLVISRDSGATWPEVTRVASQPVARIWQDPDRPDTALAAAVAHLFRIVNGGPFWDDVTGTLVAGAIHGIAADRSAGVVYLATDRGVFQGTLSLNDAGPAATNWKAISSALPAAVAWDVRLNSDNTLTAALDGYGVFETPAPHQTRNVRLVNGADMSDRAAAPGSIISVIGANVKQASDGSTEYPVISSADMSSLQVPFEAAAGQFSLSLEGANGTNDRWTVPLTVKDASPAIFVDPDGSPIILDSSSGLVIDQKEAVHAGAVIQVMATGLGKVTPDWPTGVAAPIDSPPAVRGAVAAFLDGTPVQVTRATLAPGYVGYYLVELQIPAIVNKGVSELRIVMNGEESNRVKLYLDADPAP